MIRYLRHNEIDKAQWDALLTKCPDRLWYMQSWVLDLCCPQWEALVDEEAGVMMPLLWRRKYGVSYLYQPYALQQQGVYARQHTAALDEAFLQAIPTRFKYWDMHVNAKMIVPDGIAEVTESISHELGPIPDPEKIRAGYSQGHRRNLRKCGDHPPKIIHDISAAEFVQLFTETTAKRFGGIPHGGLALLQAMIEQGEQKGQCKLYGVRKRSALISAVCTMDWGGRSILLKSANSEAGSEQQSMFHLVDAWIHAHAGKQVILDFAGSNTPSVARFNEGFGARTTVYLRLVRNRLPAPLRWFKR